MNNKKKRKPKPDKRSIWQKYKDEQRNQQAREIKSEMVINDKV